MHPPSPVRSALDLIGNTPLIELTRTETGCCRLFLKLECQNPGGSIKDRPARRMIRAAEESGRLRPGATIIEGTAGNTGLGLALIARLKGYRMVVVMPDKMAREKAHHLRALGAEIVPSRSDVSKGHPDYYSDLAARLERETPGSLYINQFANPANVAAHEFETGPEILSQMDHRIDAFVAGAGTGGTITGVGRALRKANPDIALVLADPTGSVLAPLITEGVLPEAVGNWAVEGIGEDYVPPILELDRVTEAIAVTDAESFAAARALLTDEGLLAGSSTGTLLAAALRWCRRQTRPQRVVTLACDTGNKYLNRMFDDGWMREEGHAPGTVRGNLGDLVMRRHEDGQVVTVSVDAPLATACGRLRDAGGDRPLPVLDDQGRVRGVIDAAVALDAIRAGRRDASCGEVAAPGRSLDVGADRADLERRVAQAGYAVVTDDDLLIGVVTGLDLLREAERIRSGVRR